MADVVLATAILCMLAGSIVFLGLLALARLRGARGGLLLGWGMLVWTAAMLAAVALALYGALILFNGAFPTATLAAAFAFIVAFELTLVAATRLLLPVDEHTIHARAAAAAQVFIAVALFAYLALLAFWDTGSALAALTPLLLIIFFLGLVAIRRYRTHRHSHHHHHHGGGGYKQQPMYVAPLLHADDALTALALGQTDTDAAAAAEPAPAGASSAFPGTPTIGQDLLFALLLLLTAVLYALSWLVCTEGAHAVLWPFLLLLHGINLAVRLRAQARGART
jgi:hypothetical protein